ncbi:hypothetical protein [Haloferula sp.]|uniref:hypothetical protein n=1 Tax=Haloferula sp. TaxID=2497595 RepID=UPI003AF56A09
MSKEAAKYWFPAKRYGWGWGLPSAWQGWVVMLVFIGVLCALPMVVDPTRNPLLFVSSMIASSAVLISICYAKGEPPRWRWGKSGDDSDQDA